MKKTLIFVITVCIIMNSFSQQSNKISEKEFENLRIKAEKSIGIYPDSAIFYSEKLMIKSKESNSQKFYAKALSTAAIVKYRTAHSDEAMQYNTQSFLINKKLKNTAEIAKNYNVFGGINECKTNYVEAAKYYFISLDLAKKLNLNLLIYRNYLGLGQINLVNRNHENALRYFFKALEIEKKNPDPDNKAEAYISLGTCYTFMNNQNIAEKYFGTAFVYYKKKGLKLKMAMILVERSNLYYQTDPLKAIELQLEAQSIYDKMAPDCLSSAYNIVYLGESYFELAKNDSLFKQIKYSEIPKSKEKLLLAAKNYYKRGIKIYKKHKNTEGFITTSGLISDLQAYKSDYKNAYKNLQYKFKFNDSLFSQKNKNAIAKFESEKEVLQLKTINKQKATLNKILIGSSIGFLMLGLLGYRNFRNKQKLQNLKISELEKDKQLLAIDAMLKIQEEERGRIAKDLHDGLGGLLSSTKLSFTNMKENLLLTPENATQFEKSLNMLDTTIADLRKVAHNLMPEALVRFGLNEALSDFCNSIQSTTKITVDYQKIGVERKINTTTETFIYRIIQELVNNAVKHANAKEIIAQLAFTDNKIVITVEDNGKGYEINNIKNKKGDGLNNIDYRVQYLNGTIDTITSLNNGTSVNIELNA